MKFSLRYLLQFIEDLPYEPVKIVQQLNNLGLEVENCCPQENDDCLVEVAVAPNRADLLSLTGIARELATLNNLIFKFPELIDDTTDLILGNYCAQDVPKCSIHIDAEEACPKYLARIVRNIKTNQDTPEWIKQALICSGIKLIAPVVDIVNYVMLELGQPMHAFDLAKINNQTINIRMAKAESILLLDNNKINLTERDLVISDDNSVLALAGIMGGLSSLVTPETTDILLECAYFDPINIRMSMRHHNIITDAAQRFSRGIDTNLQHIAMLRVSQLLREIVGGEFFPIVSALHKQYLPKTSSVILNRVKIENILGTCIPDQQIISILTNLQMEVAKKTSIGWTVTIPSWRRDLVIEEDLIEEIARFVGYDKIIPQKFSSPLKFKSQENNYKLDFTQELEYKNCLASRGYFEVINYSFIAPDLAALIYPKQKLYKLKNPIAQTMSVMRSGLWCGLLSSLLYNQHRQQHRIRLFELGNVFDYHHTTNDFRQQKNLAGIIAGNWLAENWQNINNKSDFFHLKSDIEAILSKYDNISFKTISNIAALHPNKSAAIYINNNMVGVMGELHPDLITKLSVYEPVLLFELNLEKLTKPAIPKFTELSKYPAIRRDFSILVDKNITAEQLKLAVMDAASDLFKNIIFFDVYYGANLAENQKSIAFGVLLQHASKTLELEEITCIETKIIKNLKNIGATLR